jgi:hypothetical protein
MIQRYDGGGSEAAAQRTTQRTTFTYDVGTNAWGRLGSAAYSGGGASFTESYAYSVGGLVTAKTLAMGTRRRCPGRS